MEPWDFQSRADERRRYFDRIIDAEYSVVRRQRTLGFLSCCVLIAGVALLVVLHFAWKPILWPLF
jgi:hypothetical protein